MAGNRLALAGCKEATEGPFILAKGNEDALKIVGLGEGECIELHLVRDDDLIVVEHFEAGVFPFPRTDTKKYRVVKRTTSAQSITHVEIIVRSHHG